MKKIKPAKKKAPVRNAKMSVRKKGRTTTSPAKKKARVEKIKSSFRYLEHTGDIMIEARGPSFPLALVQAAMAMFKVMGPAQSQIYFEVDESALSRDELVVYFLSKVLGEVEAREMVPSKVEVLRYTDGPAYRMRANIWGENKRPRDAVKAVTFHELKVEEDLRRGWRIQVLLDV